MTIKSAIMTSVLAASLVTSVFATEASTDKPQPQFTAADTHVLFEQNTQSMQLAALSQQEMKETEGAAFSLTLSPQQITILKTIGIDPNEFMRVIHIIYKFNPNEASKLYKKYFGLGPVILPINSEGKILILK